MAEFLPLKECHETCFPCLIKVGLIVHKVYEGTSISSRSYCFYDIKAPRDTLSN